MPGWAAHWLVAGEDGGDLRTPAGLGGRDADEVRDVLEGALADCGVSIPSAGAATAALSFNHLARMFVDGRAGPGWVAEIMDHSAGAWPGSLVGGHGGVDADQVARACAELTGRG